jgi:hypothetical protein
MRPVINHYQLGQKVQIQHSGNRSETSSTGIVQAVKGDVVGVRVGALILRFSSSTGDMLPRLQGGHRGPHLRQLAPESGGA